MFGSTLLLAAALAAEPQEVTVTATKEAVEFRVGKELVTRYHVAPTVVKPYFWPLNAPGEVPVTRGWPMEKGLPKETKDHVHQKSAWFCHGDVIPEGITLKTRSADKNVKGVDFWSESKGHGVIACVKVGPAKAGKGTGSVGTLNEWRTPDGDKILDEVRTITLHDLGADGRLIVVDVDLHASVCPVTFGDTKEGSFGVRVNDQIAVSAKAGGEYVNAEGQKGERAIWGKKSPWCDYYGPIDGKVAGVAVFDDPNNPPACWHARGYGLMAANPFGRSGSGFPDQQGKTDLIKLAKGDHLKLRYGILTHPGDTKQGKVAEAYERFFKKGTTAAK
jgi:hypothetical protein